MTKSVSAPKRPVALVVAPMPVFPTSAGNRRRLLETCEALKRAAFEIDFAYFAHEDQIYRRFGQLPPTDDQSMAKYFRHLFRITPQASITLRTPATHFGLDDWCPDEIVQFVKWYQANFKDLEVIIVNYIFLSRCLLPLDQKIRKIIDTHDRFSARHKQYISFRGEPNFFHTSQKAESEGLARADLVLAIQEQEATFFRSIASSRVLTLPPRVKSVRAFKAPRRIQRYGFIGHGNDANLFSIGKFIAAVASLWTEGQPELVVAGEICGSLSAPPAGVQLLGYLKDLDTFYDSVDVVIAPMLFGTGLKMKVIEALSYGVPVLGTAIGFEGLPAVAPEHGYRHLPDLAERIFELAEDSDGLRDLSIQCDELFARYQTAADRAEKDFVGFLDNEEATSPILGTPDRSQAKLPAGLTSFASDTVMVGSVLLTCERSLRSQVEEDEKIGTLVATERWTSDQEQIVGYTPTRRRWFASFGGHASDRQEPSGAANPFRGLTLDHSREWVRARSLPRKAREILAALIAEAAPDWTSEGCIVGTTPTLTLVNAPIPSDLINSQAVACYLLDGCGGSRSALLRRSVRLAVPLGSFVNRSKRYPLTFQHTGLTLEIPEPRPFERKATVCRLLILSDDLIGLADLRPAVTTAAASGAISALRMS